uniref:ACB domain-containing protein n=1 Tax=Parastrongyloides trichosuri TaxID=131310 RepID=A0A0N4ZUM3_PARTI
MSIEEDKIESSLDEQFFAAVKVIQNLPKEGPVSTSNDTKLMFYSLFKQATIGPCNQAQPGFWNVIERYKWDAWNKLGDMNKEAAMKKYLSIFNKQIDETVTIFGVDYFLNLEKSYNLEGVLEPAFKTLGRSLKNPLLNESNNKIINDIDKLEDEVKSNDGDYIDALEDVAISQDVDIKLINDINTIQHKEEINVFFIKTFSRIFTTIEEKSFHLSKDLIKLTNTLIDQNNIMKKMLMDNEKKNKVDKQPMSWKLLCILFIWPFFVHYVMKYWKMIKMLFSMYMEW